MRLGVGMGGVVSIEHSVNRFHIGTISRVQCYNENCRQCGFGLSRVTMPLFLERDVALQNVFFCKAVEQTNSIHLHCIGDISGTDISYLI